MRILLEDIWQRSNVHTTFFLSTAERDYVAWSWNCRELMRLTFNSIWRELFFRASKVLKSILHWKKIYVKFEYETESISLAPDFWRQFLGRLGVSTTMITILTKLSMSPYDSRSYLQLKENFVSDMIHQNPYRRLQARNLQDIKFRSLVE